MANDNHSSLCYMFPFIPLKCDGGIVFFRSVGLLLGLGQNQVQSFYDFKGKKLIVQVLIYRILHYTMDNQ